MTRTAAQFVGDVLKMANISTNFTALNLSDIGLKKSQCFLDSGQIDPGCVYAHICNQINPHFVTWGTALIITWFFIEFIIPWLLRRFPVDMTDLHKNHPTLFKSPINTANEDSRRQVYYWLIDRLLWAFVILTFYQISLSLLG